MGSFGEKLKREREMRAITLEEIAEATKIGTRSLRALEEEHFDQLPGGIFNKGFVRAYAKFLGIDEEQAVADYLTATGDVGGSTTTQLAAFSDQVEQQRIAKEASDTGPNTGLMLAAIIGIVVLCGILFGGYKAWKYKQQQQDMSATAGARIRHAPPPVSVETPTTSTDANPANTTPSPTDASGVATPATNPPTNATTTNPPAGTKSTDTASSPDATKTPASNAAPAQGAPMVVTLKALKSSWVQVKSDGKTVYQQTMDPKDSAHKEITLRGQERMELVLGNAAGVEVSFNGKPLGPLGTEGQARKLMLTPKGVER